MSLRVHLAAACAALALTVVLAHGADAQNASPPVTLPQWDMKLLKKTPALSSAPENLARAGMKAFFYQGLLYKGKPTRVFAWMGIPEHKPGVKVPGVVLIHGGGGTASDDGVRLWMKRGYAAIAMDQVGRYPGLNERMEDGGPRGGGECFEQVNEAPEEQWMYHAVADVVLANSILRAQPDVDAKNIGVTGLSWGGVVTGVVAGVDDRFRWAAPVYGCGYLQDSEYFKPVVEAFNKDRWIGLWDPSQYLPRAKMPLLWINGTNDDYFQLGMWQRSFRLAPGPRTISLKIRMPHSGGDGERPEEIFAFAESFARGSEPLPRLGVPKRLGANVTAPLVARTPPAKAELTYTRDTGKWSKRNWKTEEAQITGNGKQVVSTLPPGTVAYFVRVEDKAARSVTTEYEELPTPLAAPVGTGSTIHLSPRGNDANAGTASKPIASLRRARDLVRGLPRTSPITVILHAGTYRLSSPLTLDESDSGIETAPITWTAAPGEKVVISGGVPLSGWKTVRVNGKTAWSLALPEVKAGTWYFRGLFGSDNRRQRARMPNKGFFVVKDIIRRAKGENDDWLSGRDRFYFAPGDLDNWSDKAEAEVTLLTQWCESHLPLVSVDTQTRLATFSKFTIQNFGDDARYWVENTRAALDQPGEWCLNRTTGELLYMPLPGETPAKTVLIAPRASALVTLNKTGYVRFKNLTFAHTDWWFPADFRAEGYNSDKVWAIQQAARSVPGAIHADRVTDCQWENCRFAHLGSYGIVLDGPSRRNRIADSDLYDLAAGGVRIGPGSVSKNYADEVAVGNTLLDCRIYDGGKVFTGAVAVWVGQAQKTEVSHNEIRDFNYTGISCGWTWGFDDPSGARDNQIAWNHIYNLGRNVLGDGSGIYMLGGQPGTVIEGNVVHDINGNYASRGIYLDDGSSYMTVKNNLSYRNRTANYFQWRSRDNRVENNVFALGQDAQVELGGAVFNGGGLAMNFERNIIVTGPGPFLNAFDPGNVKSIYQFDRNLFWNAKGQQAIPGSVKAAGWDKNALEADPLFLALDRDDFRFAPNSPAFKAIGFEPVDWAKAGPRTKRTKWP